MAPNSFGRAGSEEYHGFAAGAPNQPPPSTLAAQLVEGISASVKSSRPDETQELQRFFTAIERVKNQPDVLKTAAERVEHNHMLIYVFGRVALDGLKWDDPFADRRQLQNETLKAINFLRVTIKETPGVLGFVADEENFMFRRGEPLWVWILPRILRLLGHEKCTAISPSIEALCRFILLTASQHSSAWSHTSAILQYFQTSVDAIFRHIGTPAIDNADLRLSLELPERSFSAEAHQSRALSSSLSKICSYKVTSVKHALRNAWSILQILAAIVASVKPTLALASVFTQTVPWLVDSLRTLYHLQEKFEDSVDGLAVAIVDCLVKLATAYEGTSPNSMECENQHKILSVLILLCGRLFGPPPVPELLKHGEVGVSARRVLCLAMAHISRAATQYRPISQLFGSQLLNRLATLVSQNEIVGTGTDFSRCVELLRDASSCVDPAAFHPNARLDQFADVDLRQCIDRLDLHRSPLETAQPFAKRRKLSAEPKFLPTVLALVCNIFKAEAQGDFLQLQNLVVNGFGALSDQDCCKVLNLVAYISCAADDTLVIAARSMTRDKLTDMSCSFCSNLDKGRQPPPPSLDPAAKAAAVTIFTRLIRLPSFLNSRKPRVVAMIALRRLVAHSNDSELLDVEKSVAGHWCLQSLNSSVRELRIASGRALASFLREHISSPQGQQLSMRNRSNALGFLKSLSDKNVAHLNETCIMAWGQVGIVIPEEELSLVLVKLLDFLGHGNTIISAFAFNEIINLASARNTPPRRLFEPFWRSIAFSTVKDMIGRPQTTRLTAELVHMSVPEYLLHVQQYVLPWLVLMKKKEIVQKIAEARGQQAAWEPCVDSANLSHILALLLVQDTPNVEEFVLSTLRHISPHFNGTTAEALLGSEPVWTALELLKDAGDADEKRRERIRIALKTMATVVIVNDKSDARKKKNVIARFLVHHALGLASALSEVVNESSARNYTVYEQRRSIRAMEEIIKLCKYDIRIARPQIAAFLLSALSYDELRASAFSCWSVMLFNLDEDDVDVLLETTFFIISHYWRTFDDITKAICHDLLDRLLTKHKALLNAKINELPSFSNIPDLAEADRRLGALRKPLDNRSALNIFAKRLGNENPGVVLRSLIELSEYLRKNQGYIQTSAISEQPDTAVTALLRALLDCSSKYNQLQPAEITSLCVQCIGHVGCLDSNRLETVREHRQFVLLRNFVNAGETGEFVLFILEEVLVKAFLSATDTAFQGYLAYTMQELLDKTDFKVAYVESLHGRPVSSQALAKWHALPEGVRDVLTPFMVSRYRIKPISGPPVEFPLFRPSKPYGNWLRALVFDLLGKGQNPFAQIIFEPLRRVVKVKELIVSEFLLPYLVVHIMVGDDTVKVDRDHVMTELRSILLYEIPDDASYAERENVKLYREAVFRVLDYSMRWLQLRRSGGHRRDRHNGGGEGIGGGGGGEEEEIRRVQRMIDALPADLISRRAVDCRQYARALFHLEPHATKVRDDPKADPEETSRLLSELQHIYTQIDEPDGLEGISASLTVVDLNQQILSHRKAGRWSQAQTWYEIRLAEEPNNVDVQLDLLTCLKESGQYDVLLNYVEGISTTPATINRIAPFAVEASWATGRWETLQKYLSSFSARDSTEIFNMGIGHALLCLKEARRDDFAYYVRLLRDRVGSSMSEPVTSSLQACHDALLKAHVLADLELIAEQPHQQGQAGHDATAAGAADQQETLTTLSRRLEVIGAYVNDKQYLLGIRRAAMELMRPKFGDGDISSLWLSSARLARKAGSMHQSFNAVLHAHQLGDGSATIDNARLLWKEGNHRKAIQVLQSAISRNDFIGHSIGSVAPTSSKSPEMQKNLVTAQAHLLLAKWLDSAGQTHASALRQQYQLAAKTHSQWEKGHYYLGRHYKKVLESEKALSRDDQSAEYLSGETAKLVIQNYMRSLMFGTKYLYQTLPRILTLWLELGAQVGKEPEPGVSVTRELNTRRKQQLEELHKHFNKHLSRMPAYIFYTALPQMVARIAHPNVGVFQLLQQIIVKVVEAHPRQSLWSLFGVMTSKQSSDRRTRGLQILQALNKGSSKKAVEGGGAAYDLRQLIRTGEKLAEQLLLACNNGDFQSNRTTVASLTRDLNFNAKCTPCPLVVPIESCLTATLPALTDNVRKHKAFSQDLITVHSFLDEVLVLSSLAKPRKLTARGSDGKTYGLMIKPKDDLRTDQRLMEFNGMINRSLKRDAESSRRQLYIRTYAVTPLNEECGIIEWVDGLKTLRDILLGIYKSRGISPNYGSIQNLMRDASLSENNTDIFTKTVLGMFPAVLPSWFTSQFPNPSAWFAARLRYTRSCAVMSMVGTILGLGDRHGENVLLEEGNGGVFHVDFNCLFDKGLTFATPERVPFRLTHNMTAAMGLHGHEGPFRRCSELTLSILRQQEETLMTILEAFIYDPTLDLQKGDRRRRQQNDHQQAVRLNPQSVVDSIRRKVRGLLPDESIPLGVEGQVEELIKQAVDPRNLTSMYIGWCPFL